MNVKNEREMKKGRKRKEDKRNVGLEQNWNKFERVRQTQNVKGKKKGKHTFTKNEERTKRVIIKLEKE